MPASFRLATFNVENLFSRPEFTDHEGGEDGLVGVYRFEDAAEGRIARRINEAVTSDDKRQLTALALMQARADIVCLQEVDDREALEIFYGRYMKRLIEVEVAAQKRAVRDAALRAGRIPAPDDLYAVDRANYFDWRILVEGNDGRGIDVALLSRRPVGVRTHAHRTFAEMDVWSQELAGMREKVDGRDRRLSPSDRVFRRDCLEVDFEVGGRPMTVFVCHFKSMAGNRDQTRPLRRAEALAVRKIIEQRFGAGAAGANWAICGDLNDYREIDGLPIVDDYGKLVPSGLDPLLQDDFAVNIMRRRPADDRWTTYHGAEDQYAQLDYILLSPALAAANPDAVPDIVRGGQPFRSSRHQGPRFPRVGWDRPKASDHCPVVVELTVP